MQLSPPSLPNLPAISEILERMRALEDRLEQELEKSRAQYNVRFRGKIAEFQLEIRRQHRLLRQSLPRFFLTANALNVLVAPVIYSMILPIALLDLWVTIYQHICFRAFGIPRVKRSDYIVFDRHHLAYLNIVEATNCVYCGYGNGVFSYAREIASRTEQYWCPIKHARRLSDPHKHYLRFLEYGDAQGYAAQLDAFRADLKKIDEATSTTGQTQAP